MAGSTVGIKRNVEVLNKAGIVLTVACWEAFVEDLAEVAFKCLLRRAKAPEVFPIEVRLLASQSIHEGKDARLVWELAADGWRKVLDSHQRRHVGGFQSPEPVKVDKLFESLLGMKGLSKSWSWHTTTPARARSRLTRLIRLRGAIAHRVSVSRSVKKRDVQSAIVLIQRLAIATHNRVNEGLGSRLSFRPWEAVAY